MSSRVSNGGSFNYVSSYMVIEIIQTRVNVKAVINTMKYEWLFIPTQLSVQGQWWSNLSTHLLQIEQCRDLGVRTISQSGQSWTGSMSCKRFYMVKWRMNWKLEVNTYQEVNVIGLLNEARISDMCKVPVYKSYHQSRHDYDYICSFVPHYKINIKSIR